MNPIKFIWGFFFRLFPCPTRTGLRRIGKPDRNSPVLVTCNFYITVRRLLRRLKGFDLWLLVVDSKGVNVWCAAAGDEFNTHSVVAAVKTSGLAELVEHRGLILPPAGAPGIKADEVKKKTGFSARWGPFYLKDLPRYLREGKRRDESMKRAKYGVVERLDTALGSMFPFYLIGAIGFLIFGRDLLVDYLLIGMVIFLFFYISCPWLPGSRGLTKAILPLVLLAGALVVTEVWHVSSDTFPIRADLIIAMVMFFIYSTELGGLSSTMPSDLDPFLARLGVGAIGNVALAGTIRTELLNGYRILTYYRDRCIGCRCCNEVCPQGVWDFAKDEKKAVFAHKDDCTACRACLVQCKGDAIVAEQNRTEQKDNFPLATIRIPDCRASRPGSLRRRSRRS